MATVIERVRAGATLLDATVPGWASRVNPRVLDLGRCTGCILGQLFSDALDDDDYAPDDDPYLYGCKILNIKQRGRRSSADSLGFHAECVPKTKGWNHGLSDKEYEAIMAPIDAEYSDLTVAWLVEIALRLGTPAAEEARIEASPVDAGEAWGAL